MRRHSPWNSSAVPLLHEISLMIQLRTECQPENIVRPISCPLVRVNVALLSSRARKPKVAPPTRRDSNQPCRLVEVRVPS